MDERTRPHAEDRSEAERLWSPSLVAGVFDRTGGRRSGAGENRRQHRQARWRSERDAGFSEGYSGDDVSFVGYRPEYDRTRSTGQTGAHRRRWTAKTGVIGLNFRAGAPATERRQPSLALRLGRGVPMNPLSRREFLGATTATIIAASALQADSPAK